MVVGDIPVYQTVQRYEKALERHGQYVRWHSTIPCYCIQASGDPDPHCTKCKGRGYKYFPVTTIRKIERHMSAGDNTLTVDYEIKSINSVYKGDATSVSYDSFSGRTITFPADRRKGEYIYVDYEEDLELDYVGTDVTFIDGDVLLKVGFPSITTVNGSFKGEIVSVSLVRNVTQASDITVVSYRDDLIKIDSGDVPLLTDEIRVECKYINPVNVLISHTDYKSYKGEEITPTDQADMQVTVPGTMEVGRGDIFTLLKAEQRGSFVGLFDSALDFYQAPYFSLTKLLRIEDSTGLITDATIQNNNEIVFTTEPTGNFSCLVKYNPSFMVDEIPDPRNAENKMFPRKMTLKRMDVLNKKNKSPRHDDEVIF